jgi:hypothetical protein
MGKEAIPNNQKVVYSERKKMILNKPKLIFAERNKYFLKIIWIVHRGRK